MFLENDTFYEDGQLLERIFYRNGEPEGECKMWYPNGQLQEQVFYQNGELEGKHKWWYENGRLRAQKFYRNGEREGEYKYWHENGQLREQTFYQNGKLIDPSFNHAKKNAFLRLKYPFRKRVDLFSSVIIFDLANIICM